MKIILRPEHEMETEELGYILDENDVKQRSVFIVNSRIQVILITDLKTGKKLDEDHHVSAYLRAVVQADLLIRKGISDPDQIVSIARSEVIDVTINTIIISLEMVTNIDGVEELRCYVLEEGLLNESSDQLISEESLLWNGPIAELTDLESSDSPDFLAEAIPGPSLRWSSEMTRQLINIRGEMDREFAQAKYKFHLWVQVAMKLNEILNNVKVTAKDCDDKWRNIVATYRKNIDKIRCCGDNNIRWEYFTAMDKILKGTREIQITTEVHQNLDETLTDLMYSLNSTDESSPIEEIDLDELEEPPQDCIITRKLNGEKRRWTTEQCLLLLYLRREADSKFQKSCDRASNQWRELASQMNMSFLSDFTANELESVWNHCNINYEVNLETLTSKGVDSISWKYFAVMDELRGGTQEIAELCVPRPGEYLLDDFQKLKHPTLSPRMDVVTFNAKYETDSEDTSSISSSSGFWTQDMVIKLISLKKTIEHDLTRHKIPRRKQWSILVRRFRSLKNVKVTERACEAKWRNLVRTYKSCLEQVNRRGTCAVRWQYFWRMHEILGNSVDSEKSAPPLANSSPSIETLAVPCNNTLTSSRGEQFLVGSRDEINFFDDRLTNSLHDDASVTIDDMRNVQNKMLREIIEKQNKNIEELHREQLNIKTLLTQLLQKFQ